MKDVSDLKFFGVCIIIATVVLSFAIVWQSRIGRYQYLHPGDKAFDSTQ
jgi:hypothetical protein